MEEKTMTKELENKIDELVVKMIEDEIDNIIIDYGKYGDNTKLVLTIDLKFEKLEEENE